MNKIFYTLLLLVSIAHAQESSNATEVVATQVLDSKTYLLNNFLLKKEDFKSSNGRMLATSIPCKIQNGEITAPILISVICMQKAFQHFGIDKINNMIMTAHEKVGKTIQPGDGYHPKEIKMAYMPDSQDWRLTSAFSITDQHGIIVERLLSIDFDREGKFSVMKRIL